MCARHDDPQDELMDERKKAKKVAFGTLAVLVPLCLAVVVGTAAESTAWWEVALGTVLAVVFLCCVIGALTILAGMLWQRLDPEAEGAQEKNVMAPLELSPRDVIASIDDLEGPICVYSDLAVDDLLEAIGIAK